MEVVDEGMGVLKEWEDVGSMDTALDAAQAELERGHVVSLHPAGPACEQLGCDA